MRWSQFRVGSARSLYIDGFDVALFRDGDALYAVKNFCPHQQFRKLHEGEICDGAVTCPMHGWTFDLATGVARTGQGRFTIYPVTIVNDEIYVDLPA